MPSGTVRIYSHCLVITLAKHQYKILNDREVNVYKFDPTFQEWNHRYDKYNCSLDRIDKLSDTNNKYSVTLVFHPGLMRVKFTLSFNDTIRVRDWFLPVDVPPAGLPVDVPMALPIPPERLSF